LKIRHGAIVDNVVTNLHAKFDDDRLRNEKALVLMITTSRTRRTTFVALGDPFPGLTISCGVYACSSIVLDVQRRLTDLRRYRPRPCPSQVITNSRRVSTVRIAVLYFSSWPTPRTGRPVVAIRTSRRSRRPATASCIFRRYDPPPSGSSRTRRTPQAAARRSSPTTSHRHG